MRNTMSTYTRSSNKASAPSTPHMIPRGPHDKNAVEGSDTTRSADPGSSLLQLLKIELGKDAHLLDRIPLANIKMIQSQQINDHLPYKIYVGTIANNGAVQEAWAFLSAETVHGQEIMPRMSIYSGPKQGVLNRYTGRQMNDAEIGSWADVFKKVYPESRATYIKTCFILKGVQLPMKTQFPKTFVASLKMVCRALPVGKDKNFEPGTAATATPTLAERVLKPMLARKSQQHGPRDQLFSLHPAAPPQDHQTVPRTSRLALFQSGPTQTSNDAHGSAAVTKCAVSRDLEGGSPFFDDSRFNTRTGQQLIGATISKTPPGPIKHSNRALSSDTNVTPKPGRRIQEASQPTSAESERLCKSEHESPTAITQGSHDHISVKRGYDISIPAEHVLDELRGLQEQLIDIEKKLNELSSLEDESVNRFRGLRRELIHGIDVEMQQKHEVERKKLWEKHKAEKMMAKENFDSVKWKYEHNIQELRERRHEMLKQQELIEEDMKRLCETPNQMRELLNECSRERAQKRKKTWHSGDATGAD